MGEKELLRAMSRHGREAPASLDEAVRTDRDGWSRLRDAARAHPAEIDDAVLAWMVTHIDESPGTVLATLLDLAAKDESRRALFLARFRELMPSRLPDALRVAGHNLYEWCRLLDAGWIADARTYFEANPEGAWNIATSAAYYKPGLLTRSDVDWFEERLAAHPLGYFRVMLHLAANDDARRDNLLSRALERFDKYPRQAVEAAAGVRGEKGLIRPELVWAVLRHLPRYPEKGWEFFSGIAYHRADIFSDDLIDALSAHVATGARAFFGIVHRVAGDVFEKDPARARRLIELFARLVPAHPAEAIDAAHYVAANDAHLLSRALVDAVCLDFASDAYHAFDVLRYALERRPELVGAPQLGAAVQNVAHATNWAFGFFRRALELRPEFTPICTAALFECLALEPANRATTRVEELQAIMLVAQSSHVKTALDRALRQPPSVGSRRARALMAILFRQTSRSKQHVLFEALGFAATACTWSNRNRTPLWDFMMILLDHAADDAVSTAGCERFLEGAFQLHFLMSRGADHDAFRARFDVVDLEPVPWPWPSVGFLAGNADVSALYPIVWTLASRCGATLRLAPMDAFQTRVRDAEQELESIQELLAKSDPDRRDRLQKRCKMLSGRIRLWRDPRYERALSDPAAEEALGAEERASLCRERREMEKRTYDALCAELLRIAIEAVEGSRLELYGQKLREALGREVDVRSVETTILPAFLFFSSLNAFPNNRRWLARLIEDRMERRPHEWLWAEPPVIEWKESVRKAQPSIVFERWRARFTKEYAYRPGDAAAEKKRRIKDDLAQARRLLEEQGARGIRDSTLEELARALGELRAEGRAAGGKKDEEPRLPPPDAAALEEVAMNLERVRIVSQTPESDYEGRITLEVETDPFEVLFMGEYGFASCLSLRGPNVWSAVSNAIDVDKAVVWAREPAGNVVGRRLITLTPAGVVSYRTYANRHGLSLDGMFEDFVGAYARHCGTSLAHGRSPGPLLSDRWYDDGAL